MCRSAVKSWCTPTPLYRRRLTDKIGPWTSMRGSQDWEYDARAGALGAKLVTTGTYVSEHYHHDGVRQTGDADWRSDPVRLRNRLDLLEALWRCAQEAGVSETAPERQHFARWAFKIGRECAAANLGDEAGRCLEIARDSAAGGPAAKGIDIFRRISMLVGFRVAGRGARWSESLRGGRGSSSMSQSFENG